MAQQGQIAAQRSSASIGQQEVMNQRLRQQEAGRLQTLERQGDLISRAQERERVSTLLGMSQAEAAAYGQARGQATQAKWDAIGSGFTNIANIGIAGLQAGAFDGKKTFGDVPSLRQNPITLQSISPTSVNSSNASLLSRNYNLGSSPRGNVTIDWGSTEGFKFPPLKRQY